MDGWDRDVRPEGGGDNEIKLLLLSEAEWKGLVLSHFGDRICREWEGGESMNSLPFFVQAGACGSLGPMSTQWVRGPRGGAARCRWLAAPAMVQEPFRARPGIGRDVVVDVLMCWGWVRRPENEHEDRGIPACFGRSDEFLGSSCVLSISANDSERGPGDMTDTSDLVNRQFESLRWIALWWTCQMLKAQYSEGSPRGVSTNWSDRR